MKFQSNENEVNPLILACMMFTYPHVVTCLFSHPIHSFIHSFWQVFTSSKALLGLRALPKSGLHSAGANASCTHAYFVGPIASDPSFESFT